MGRSEGEPGDCLGSDVHVPSTRVPSTRVPSSCVPSCSTQGKAAHSTQHGTASPSQAHCSSLQGLPGHSTVQGSSIQVALSLHQSSKVPSGK